MRAAAVFPLDKAVRLIDIPEPGLERASDVKIRMLEVGLCGTDRDIAQFHYGSLPAGSDYLIIGHESFGEVVETGPKVTALKPGDPVVIMVRRPCKRADCIACRSGRQDFCYSGTFTERGIKEQGGFLAEYIVDDEAYVIRAAPELGGAAVLTEPLTIAEKALEQLYSIQERLPWGCRNAREKDANHACHTAVILGAGPVGLLGAMLLRAEGFRTFVYSRENDESAGARLTRSIGGEYYCSENLSPDQLAVKTGNIDVIYEATGAAKVSFNVMKILGVNGVFIFTGVPGVKEPIEFDAGVIMKNLVLKNQVVYGTVNAGRKDFAAAVKDLARFEALWPGALKTLITARHGMEKVPELLAKHPGGIKHVISVAG